MSNFYQGSSYEIVKQNANQILNKFQHHKEGFNQQICFKKQETNISKCINVARRDQPRGKGTQTQKTQQPQGWYNVKQSQHSQKASFDCSINKDRTFSQEIIVPNNMCESLQLRKKQWRTTSYYLMILSKLIFDVQITQINQWARMGLKKIIREFILRFDFFATPATLRCKSQPCYESIQCGIFSLILIGIFIANFYSSVMAVLTKSDIQYSSVLTDSPNSQKSVQNIQFSVKIDGLSLQQMLSHFEFIIKSVQHNQNGPEITNEIQLTPCTSQSWQAEGDQVKKYFNQLSMSQMLCIPEYFSTALYGYEGSQKWSQLQLKINRCKIGNLFPCSSNLDFDSFTQNYLDDNDFFKVRLFLLDSVFRLEDPQPVVKTINRDMFLSFTDALGSRGQINYGAYEIETDQSIWPFSNQTIQQGIYVDESFSQTTGIRSDRYVWVSLYKSTIQMEVTRNYGKIDDLLAYIGGLFSIIFFVLLFFFGSYNEYRYELMVGQRCFTHEGKKNDFREGDMGIWGYLCYQFYEWLNMFGINLCWQSMKKIHEARQQTCEQIDICYIVRKLQYLEQVIQKNVQKSILICSSLIGPQTLQQAKIKRKIITYYHKLLSYQPNSQLKKSNQLSTSILHSQQTGFANSPMKNQIVINNQSQLDKNRYAQTGRNSKNQHHFHQMGTIFPSAKLGDQIRKKQNVDMKMVSQAVLLGTKIKSISELRKEKKSEKRNDIVSEQKILEKQQNQELYKKKESFCNKLIGKIQGLFDDQPDSQDEQAQKQIAQMYKQLQESRGSVFSVLQKQIPLQMKESITKAIYNQPEYKKTPKKDKEIISVDLE